MLFRWLFTTSTKDYGINMNKPIRVFSLPWHIAHQYELLKLSPEVEFTYLINYARKWGEQARPMPEHLKWTTCYEPGKYDLAILHVDQQCLSPKLSVGKAGVFRQIRSQIKDIPIIVINHGTPVYPEAFMQLAEQAGFKATEQGAEEWARIEMKRLLEGVSEMVVNSHQAQEMWGWGKAIIHGLDPSEWWNSVKEPRITTFISAAGIGQKYYGRRLFQRTREALLEKYGIELVWIGQDKYCGSFDEYRDFLGKSLIYFNPTFGSPMPRTRTEAMMSGSCIVTTKHHDADKFIEDGVNGFLVKDNPEHCAKVLADLTFDYKKAYAVGQQGRKDAIKLFNVERFKAEWLELIKSVIK